MQPASEFANNQTRGGAFSRRPRVFTAIAEPVPARDTFQERLQIHPAAKMVTQASLAVPDRMQLAELRHALEQRRGGQGSDSATRPVCSTVEQQAIVLIAATSRWFPPGLLAAIEEQDPEDPTNVYLVLDVQASGDFAQIEHRRAAWQTDAYAIFPGDLSWLRLCIYPR